MDDRIEWPDFDGDGDADFTLANDSPIRFAIPEGVGQNRATSRYGIDLEQTYYVRAATADDFQISLSTDPSVAAVNHTNDDLTGLTDQLNSITPVFPLIDADRFQLCTVATTSSTSRVAPSGNGPLTLQQTAEAEAFAGGRERDTTLTDTTSGLDKAMSWGISGSSGQATTVGDSAAVDDALANLNMVARSVRSAEADDDISIAAEGTITPSTSLEGRSVADPVQAQISAELGIHLVTL